MANRPSASQSQAISIDLDKLIVEVAKLPTQAHALKVINRVLEAGVSYQDLAKAAMPTVSDLKIQGNHISMADGLRQRSYTVEEAFAEEPELLASVIRLPGNERGTSARRYYAMAPLCFTQSADYVFVGEHIDVVGMAANNPYWRNQLLGIPNESYDIKAKSGSPESIEWMDKPATRSGMEPKKLVQSLIANKALKKQPKFLTAAEMQAFLDSAPTSGTKPKADVPTAEDVLASFGLF